jgi:hypothetical protein
MDYDIWQVYPSYNVVGFCHAYISSNNPTSATSMVASTPSQRSELITCLAITGLSRRAEADGGQWCASWPWICPILPQYFGRSNRQSTAAHLSLSSIAPTSLLPMRRRTSPSHVVNPDDTIHIVMSLEKLCSWLLEMLLTSYLPPQIHHGWINFGFI